MTARCALYKWIEWAVAEIWPYGHVIKIIRDGVTQLGGVKQRWRKQVFIHTRLSRAYLALARLSCFTHPSLVWRTRSGGGLIISGWNIPRKKTRRMGLLYGENLIILTSTVFTAQCTLVQSAVLRSHVSRLSVRLSLCLSVTLVDCDHIGWNSSKIISPLVSLGCSLFATPTWRVCSKVNTLNLGPKWPTPCWFERRRHSIANCGRMVTDSATVTMESL